MSELSLANDLRIVSRFILCLMCIVGPSGWMPH